MFRPTRSSGWRGPSTGCPVAEHGRYRKLYPRLWRHPGFRGLTPAARELALYILAGPQTNAVGLFAFSPAAAAEDLNLETDAVREAMAMLHAVFGWEFDPEARVLYIPSWWRWNRPENVNILKGNLKALQEVPANRFLETFRSNTEWLPTDLHATFQECVRERSGNASRNASGKGSGTFKKGSPKPSPIQDQDQDQDQDHRSRFQRWWSAYPKHVAKQAALKAWRKLEISNDLLERMLAVLALQKQSPAWLKNGGEFIPHPATYLNQRRFEDEIPVSSDGPAYPKWDECRICGDCHEVGKCPQWLCRDCRQHHNPVEYCTAKRTREFHEAEARDIAALAEAEGLTPERAREVLHERKMATWHEATKGVRRPAS